MNEARAVVPKVKGLNCPGCGNALEIRGMGRAISVTCPACLRVLDARDPNLKILAEYMGAQRVIPEIPLGKRGVLSGAEYEVIGFQERQVIVDMVAYCWYEYLLFNPYKGYKYLVNSMGHWNEVTPIHAIPRDSNAHGKRAVEYDGQKFTHFQSSDAQTSYVFGEFPWEVHKGETVRSDDFIAAPRMLSREKYSGEITWSLAQYRDYREIAQSFGVPLNPPSSGTPFANQPNPYIGKPTRAWMWFLATFAAMILLAMFLSLASSSKVVFDRTFTVDAQSEEDKAFVTETFEIPSAGMLHVDLHSDVSNNEAFVGITLINETTGRGWEFARTLSHYSGTDDGESWTEGSKSATVNLAGIPAGTYYFRIAHNLDGVAGALPRPVRYSINARRGSGIAWGLFFLVLLLLAIPPIWYTMQKSNFETRRWLESDYAPEQSSSNNDE